MKPVVPVSAILGEGMESPTHRSLRLSLLASAGLPALLGTAQAATMRSLTSTWSGLGTKAIRLRPNHST